MLGSARVTLARRPTQTPLPKCATTAPPHFATRCASGRRNARAAPRELSGAVDVTRALRLGPQVLYHYFASTAGSVPSLMALGYKHMYGLGVPKSCDTAFSYYNPAAEQVRPRRAKAASRSLRRVLLTPQVNPGSLYRCGQRN